MQNDITTNSERICKVMLDLLSVIMALKTKSEINLQASYRGSTIDVLTKITPYLKLDLKNSALYQKLKTIVGSEISRDYDFYCIATMICCHADEVAISDLENV